MILERYKRIILTEGSIMEYRNNYGTGMHQGRIEVLHRGEWGTVCDDNFDIDDAHVACKQMGFGGAKSIKKFNPGKSSSPIHLDDLECTGKERSLFECPHSRIGVNNCDHNEDVGVVCTGKCQQIIDILPNFQIQ